MFSLCLPISPSLRPSVSLFLHLLILLLEPLQFHIEGLDSQSEERGGFGLVVVGLAERGIDQAAFEVVNHLWQIDSARRNRFQRGVADARREQRLVDQLWLGRADGAFQRGFEFVRSEERRVGKECGWWGAPGAAE